MRCRLLAIDLDGTLLRDDGQIDPRDISAIALARTQGITVTLATGRMPFRTLPFARQLQLDNSLICGDGVVTVHPSNGAVQTLTTLSLETRRGLLELAAQTGLPLLMLSPSAVLGVKEHEPLAKQLGGWSNHFEPLPHLDEILNPECEVVTGFFLGPTSRIAQAATLYAKSTPPGRDQTEVFRVGQPGEDTLRVLPPGVDKSTALSELARSLSIGRAEVAAVGDWYNDLPMLRWAHWSFAMGHAPDAIVSAARRKLRATAATGGAIAELVEELLGGTASP
jgi:Cof subfamily protein (haloacid dehalogenase superfamily)